MTRAKRKGRLQRMEDRAQIANDQADPISAERRERERWGYGHALDNRAGHPQLRRAFRRLTWADQLEKQGDLSDKEARSLRWYRDRHAEADYSPVKSCLNRDMGGGGDPERWRLRIADARRDVLFAENGVQGCMIDLFRGMALEDWTASFAARMHFGIGPEVKSEDIAGWKRRDVVTSFVVEACRMHRHVAHITESRR